MMLSSLIVTIVIATVLMAFLDESIWKVGKRNCSTKLLEWIGWLILLDFLIPFLPGKGWIIEMILPLNLEKYQILFPYILWVWGIGVMIQSYRYLQSLTHTKSILKMLVVGNGEFEYRGISVYVSDCLNSPVIIGWKQAIFLSAGNEWKNKLILEHEYQHLIHHDFWLKQLLNGLKIVYWWFPLITEYQEKMALIFELRIDRIVTYQMKNAEKIRYASSLLSCTRIKQSADSFIHCGYFGSKRVSFLEIRIQRVLTQEKMISLDIGIGFVVTIIFIIGKLIRISFVYGQISLFTKLG